MPSRKHIAYYAGIAAIIFIVVARLFLIPHLGIHTPFLLFLLATVAAGWAGGFRAGGGITVASAVVASYYFGAYQQSALFIAALLSGKTALFLVQGLVLSGILELLLRSRRRNDADLREQQAAEEAIRDSQRDYKAMFDLAGSGKVQGNPQTKRFSRVNRKFCEITGYGEDELLGMTFAEMTHPDDLADNPVEESSVDNQDSWTEEKRFIRKDGLVIWVAMTGATVRDHHGTPVLTVATVQDISARKAAEDRLHFLVQASSLLASSLDYETTLNQLANLAVPAFADYCVVEICDNDGRLQQIAIAHRNPKKIALLKTLREKYPPRAYENHASQSVVGGGESKIFSHITEESMRKVAIDGEHFELMRSLAPCAYLIVPIKLREAVIGTVGFMYAESGRQYEEDDRAYAEDLARRAGSAIENARLYGDLAKAKDDAESGSRMKSSFLANMSHEIRTPLNAILGFTEILRDSSVTMSDKENYYEIIHRNGQLLTRLIDDILDLSKVEAGRLGIVRSRVVISDLMAEITTVLNERIREKDVSLIIESRGLIPRVIESDPMRLRQILFNVIGNAVKFTSHGSVTVAMVYLPSSEDRTQGTMRFEVIDTGRGMTSDEAARLFQPFTQGDESMTRRYGGTGLGLVLSRRLCRALGGDIVIAKTTIGEGSTFVITVDVATLD